MVAGAAAAVVVVVAGAVEAVHIADPHRRIPIGNLLTNVVVSVFLAVYLQGLLWPIALSLLQV